MAQVSVIRDFVVALGFKTDKAAADKMKESLESVEVRAKLLNKAIVGMAVGVAFAVRQTASELDKLYFSSKRIGASAENINAYGNAISQMGGNAEQAIGTLESLAEKMRNSPGYEGMLNSLGVSTKQANGAIRDRVEVMKDLSGVLAKMPQYQANAYADSLGIDQNTLLAMRDGKFISNMEKYQKLQKAMGMNDDLTKAGNEFMTQYRDLSMMAKTGFLVILMQAGKILIPLLKGINTSIQFCVEAFSHLNPKVKDGLAILLQIALAGLMLSAFVRTLRMLKIGLSVLRIFFSFKKTLASVVKWLKVAKEWAGKLLQGLKFLFRVFAMTPIGRAVTIIMALVTALGLLWDDFQVWKEGGKSLINWGAWSEEIDYVINKIKELMEWIKNLGTKALEFMFGGVEKAHEKTVNWTESNIIAPVAEFLGQPIPLLESDKPKQSTPVKKIETPSTNKVASPQPQPQEADKPIFNMQDVKKVVGQAQTLVVGLAQSVKGNVKEVASVGNEAQVIASALKHFDITGNSKIGFLANIEHETGAGKSLSENINYSWKAFSNVAKDIKNVRTWIKAKGLNAEAEFKKLTKPEIMEIMYGHRENLGNNQDGDGYKFRGRGYMQLTGRAQYQAFADAIGRQDIMDNPDLIAKDKQLAITSAAWYWQKYSKAGKQATKGDFKGARQTANGGNIGIDDVMRLVNEYQNGGGKYNDKVLSKDIISNNNPKDLAKFAQNAQVPANNPYQPELKKMSNTSSNVTINQNYQTAMTINGAKNPQESANAVKRQQESGNIILARNAQSVMP